MMKRIVSLFLVLGFCSLVTVGLAAELSDTLAQDSVIQRADDFFNTYSITLSRQGSGYLYITFSVTAVETSAVLGVSSYDIQQKVNGVWETVESYISGYTCTDRIGVTFGDPYKGTAGGEYRVYTRFYCQKYGGASRTNGVTSGSIVAN